MKRYAVLWDVEGQKSQPVGVAFEAGDSVLVAAPSSFGLPPRFDGDYRVLQPDSTDIIYRPEDHGYFDQVLLDLSRTFAIGERSTVGVLDDATIRHVFQDKVLRMAKLHLYDAQFLKKIDENKLLWGGQSKTTNPENVGELIAEVAAAAADELEHAGLIAKR